MRGKGQAGLVNITPLINTMLVLACSCQNLYKAA